MEINAQSQPLALYGLALAAIPKKNDPNIIDVVCNPIALEQHNQSNFKALEKLKFKHSFNIHNSGEAMACFAKVVDTIAALVDRQKEALSGRGLAYRPVALMIGQDSHNPVNGNALTTLLFGAQLTSSKSEAQLRMEMLNWERTVFQNLSAYQTPDQLTEKDQRAIDKLIADYPSVYNKIVNKNAAEESDVDAAEKARNSSGLSPEFTHHAKALPTLLEQCSLRWGDYTSSAPCRESPTDVDIQIQLVLSQSGNRGKYEFNGALAQIAFQEGQKYGKKITENPAIFAFGAGEGYQDNDVRKTEVPRFSFYDWNQGYRSAFHNGFKETYKGAYTRTVRLPSAPPNPPFTDPCADLIRDQFQIIDGTRKPDNIDDALESRKLIGVLSAQSVGMAQRVGLSVSRRGGNVRDR